VACGGHDVGRVAADGVDLVVMPPTSAAAAILVSGLSSQRMRGGSACCSIRRGVAERARRGPTEETQSAARSCHFINGNVPSGDLEDGDDCTVRVHVTEALPQPVLMPHCPSRGALVDLHGGPPLSPFPTNEASLQRRGDRDSAPTSVANSLTALCRCCPLQWSVNTSGRIHRDAPFPSLLRRRHAARPNGESVAATWALRLPMQSHGGTVSGRNAVVAHRQAPCQR